MTEPSADSGASSKVLALIVDTGNVEGLKVGGIGIVERWQKGLSSFGAEVKVVDASKIGSALDVSVSDVFVLALGNWVMETLGHEAVMETAAECSKDEVVYFTAGNMSDKAPAVCIGREAAAEIAKMDLPEDLFEDGMDRFLDFVSGAGIRVVEHGLKESYWAKVIDESSAKEATWGLLKRLQFRPGGIIAKYINRPISIRISKHLVDTPITPNQTTIFAFIVGALGIVFVFHGGYWATVLGGLLLQLNSVLDGIDGELARMRLQTSEFGAYLDSICDEILNALLFVAMGYNLYHGAGWIPHWKPYLYLGIFTGVVAFTYALVHWHCKWKHGLGFYWWWEAYKPRKEVQRSTSLFSYFKKLFWKETYLMLFFLLTIVKGYEILLWIALPTSMVVIVLFFIHIVIKRARW